MKEKKVYEEPYVEIVKLDNEDIVQTSGEINFMDIPNGEDE